MEIRTIAQQVRSQKPDLSQIPHLPHILATVAEIVAAAHQVEAVAEAIDQLSPIQAEVLVLLQRSPRETYQWQNYQSHRHQSSLMMVRSQWQHFQRLARPL